MLSFCGFQPTMLVSVLCTRIATSTTTIIKRAALLNKRPTKRPTLSRLNHQQAGQVKTMATSDLDTNNQFLDRLKKESARLAPSLDAANNHKGNSGKIAVVGGSFEYTGAPYFAAISALKTGADLVHVFCAHDAATPIKCYSPELIVHPLLRADNFDEIADWLNRMDVILIGCGLGRNTETFKLIERIIGHVQKLQIPLVLDADALFLIMQKPALLIGFVSKVILTPNRMELARLIGTSRPEEVNDDAIAKMISKNNWGEDIMLLVKAADDQVFTKHKNVTFTNLGGSGRRCGGQGDVLGGCLAVFLNWALKSARQGHLENPGFVAAYAACKLTRKCNALAFSSNGRSMTAGDMIKEIHYVFEDCFEPKVK